MFFKHDFLVGHHNTVAFVAVVVVFLVKSAGFAVVFLAGSTVVF